MRRHILLISAALALVTFGVSSQTPSDHSYKPSQGYVPDAATAITIAVAVWEPIYGVEKISNQKPYVAVLLNGVWKVRGSLPSQYIGGTAEAEISKDDGKILRVSHGQ